jgi:hypothetical protein
MSTHASEDRAIDACTPSGADGFRNHILFKITVFSLSAAGGYFITHWLFSVLHQAPFWSNLAHEKARPAADVLKTLHSGFGD